MKNKHTKDTIIPLIEEIIGPSYVFKTNNVGAKTIFMKIVSKYDPDRYYEEKIRYLKKTYRVFIEFKIGEMVLRDKSEYFKTPKPVNAKFVEMRENFAKVLIKAREEDKRNRQNNFPNEYPGFFLSGLRERKGLSQQKLSDLIGISQPFICEMETGRKGISLANAKKFGKIFGIDYQLFLKDPMMTAIIDKYHNEIDLWAYADIQRLNYLKELIAIEEKKIKDNEERIKYEIDYRST